MRLSDVITWTAALCTISIFTGIRTEFGPVIVRLFDAGAGVALFVLTARASLQGRITALKKNPVYYLFVIAYLYRCVNALFLSNPSVAVKETIQVIEFVVFVHLVADVSKTREGRQRFVQLLFLLTGTLCVIVVLWHVSNGYYAGYKKLPGYSKLSFSLFALFAVFRYLKEESVSYSGWVALVALTLTVLSGERKGWVALVGGIGAMYILIEGISLRRLLSVVFNPRVIVGGALVGSIGAVLALQFEYVERQFRTMYDLYVLLSDLSLEMDLSSFETSGSNLARLYILLFAVRTTLANPVFGVGTERWHEVLAQTSGTTDPRFLLGAHSEYQRFAVENGLTGLLIYVIGWFYTIKYSVILVKNYRHDTKYYSLLIAGLSVYGSIINLFLAGGAPNILFWALPVGLIVGIENDESIDARQT